MTMSRLQFRILYDTFLFRVVDLESLSSHAQGDSGKMLGQFGALLIVASLLLSLLSGAPGAERFLISTSMLVVGLFAVLSWDSTFPDQRDVLVLAPLPLRTRTLFLAKIAASGSALGLTLLALNLLPSLMFTLAGAPRNVGLFELIFSPTLYRSFAAYWIATIGAAVFIYGSLLSLQGIASQLLARRQFLRVSAWLQMAAFGVFVSAYLIQPRSAWMPSFWFVGLVRQLNGQTDTAFAPLASRAWIALAVAGFGTAVVYTFSYLRTLRKIIEEPDIAPGSRRGSWLPRFGNNFNTAIAQFSLRTLLRGRRHRLILAFYLGIAGAVIVLFLRTPLARRMNVPLLTSSIVTIVAWVAGTRVVFAMPIHLRANWIFRALPIPGAPACLEARRRAYLALAVAPCCVASTAVFLYLWPWQPAARHLFVLLLLGLVLVELCLQGIQKIPFTCSYLPGKSNVHMTFWFGVAWLAFIAGQCARFEQMALANAVLYGSVVAGLVFIAIALRFRNAAAAREESAELRFEEEPEPAIVGLGLDQSAA
jgi:hypothetical protein